VHDLIQTVFGKRVDLQKFPYAIVCTDGDTVLGSGLLDVERGAYTLEKLCVRQEMRGIGIATSIICCAQSLRSDVKLHVNVGDTYDRLCRFYAARSFEYVYTNEHEACMLSRA